jgi:hypothetical protein
MLTRPRSFCSPIIQVTGRSRVFGNSILIPRFNRRISEFKLHTIQSAQTRQLHNMATSSTIHLTTGDTGVFKFKSQDSQTAIKTSQLLQENHDVGSHLFYDSCLRNVLSLTGLQRRTITFSSILLVFITTLSITY